MYIVKYFNNVGVLSEMTKVEYLVGGFFLPR